MRDLNETDRIIIWRAEHPQYAWYNPNINWIFLTRKVNESNIEYILNHEILHMVLNNLFDYDTTYKFDNIALTVWIMLHNQWIPKMKEPKLKRIFQQVLHFFRKLSNCLN